MTSAVKAVIFRTTKCHIFKNTVKLKQVVREGVSLSPAFHLQSLLCVHH